ncbi:MAG: methyl-accepting chemotaxis protein [Caulobacteraceae bacterium]
MKKISTKIITLSLINSLIIAVLNGAISAKNMMNMQNTTPAVSGSPAGTMYFFPASVWIGIFISLLLGTVTSYFLGLYISRPIRKITELTGRTADFNLVYDNSFDKVLKYKDECGAMAKALMDAREALREMAGKLQSISSSLTSHSEKLSKSADENVRSITQVAGTMNEIAEGSSSQAGTITDINSTVSDMVSLIDKITAKALQGSENAVKSLDTIKEGQDNVENQAKKMENTITVSHEVNVSIDELSKMIEQVAGIVDVINSIADQTNLLALNAAIEAARAGEAGKGFAVVADEIRDLADRSSEASKEIVNIIGLTSQKTQHAIASINAAQELVREQKCALDVTRNAFDKIKDAYDHIVDSFQHTADSIKIIDEKANRIFAQTQEMTAIAEESAANTQEVSAAGEEQLASTEMIAQSSRELLVLAEQVNSEINRFKL